MPIPDILQNFDSFSVGIVVTVVVLIYFNIRWRQKAAEELELKRADIAEIDRLQAELAASRPDISPEAFATTIKEIETFCSKPRPTPDTSRSGILDVLPDNRVTVVLKQFELKSYEVVGFICERLCDSLEFLILIIGGFIGFMAPYFSCIGAWLVAHAPLYGYVFAATGGQHAACCFIFFATGFICFTIYCLVRLFLAGVARIMEEAFF